MIYILIKRQKMNNNINLQKNNINEIKLFDKNFIYEYQRYYLIKENMVYKFIILKESNNIIIRCKNYVNQFNINQLSKLINQNFHNINEAYEFITNIFENNKIIINDINTNNKIKLLINNNNIEKEQEIILIYKNNNKRLIYNKLNNDEIKNEINYLKEEILTLKKEIKNIKNKNNFLNPKNIKYVKNIINDSYAIGGLDNTFSVFKSINNILYLIYANRNKSIISYDLINNKIITKIKNAHNEFITNFRHYLDIINKRDLIISISGMNNNLKLWNIKNWECLLNIKNINKNGFLFSACFLNDNNNHYILTSNSSTQKIKFEPIKVYDFRGNKIKEIKYSNENTSFIDTYYDNKLFKYYIITGNDGYVKSYDYNNNKLYHKYCANDNSGHISIIINDYDKDIKLIESSLRGNIRIWNFHSGILLKKIKISNYFLNGICLWDNDHLFVGCQDKTIKLVDIKNNLIIKSLIGHDKDVCTIKIFNHPKYGKCLISQSLQENIIKLWINENTI